MTPLAHFVVQGKRPPRPGEGHWRAVHRAKKEWTDLLGWQAVARRVPRCVPGERRRVEVDFYRPGPVGDKDNDHANCKVILDALTRCQLIEDDRPACIELEARSHSAGKSRTEIRLTRL